MGCGHSDQHAGKSPHPRPTVELIPYSDEWYAILQNMEIIVTNFGADRVRAAFFDGLEEPRKEETTQSLPSLPTSDILRLVKDTAPVKNSGILRGTLLEDDQAPVRRIQTLGSRQRWTLGEREVAFGRTRSLPAIRNSTKSFHLAPEDNDFFETTLAWRTEHLLKMASLENPSIMGRKRLNSTPVVPVVVTMGKLPRESVVKCS
eukprot:GEMP01045559.1.p1 GENE.GEMP01045559.1~~GEMP01045559.1.p1  ORF type:complete len:204 (+),score=44.30 GEMP01045559.1:157-768(+)